MDGMSERTIAILAIQPNIVCSLGASLIGMMLVYHIFPILASLDKHRTHQLGELCHCDIVRDNIAHVAILTFFFVAEESKM